MIIMLLFWGIAIPKKRQKHPISSTESFILSGISIPNMINHPYCQVFPSQTWSIIHIIGYFHPILLSSHIPAAESTRHRSFTSQWPMRSSPETADFEAELEILGPVAAAEGPVEESRTGRPGGETPT